MSIKEAEAAVLKLVPKDRARLAGKLLKYKLVPFSLMKTGCRENSNNPKATKPIVAASGLRLAAASREAVNEACRGFPK
jgi:hypothetical protein